MLNEKETALAEETQVSGTRHFTVELRNYLFCFIPLKATLQALESMRKAHQNEVQREVNRFKQEFLRQFNSDNRDQLESLAAYKEEKELEEVRQEILSLSEKYSQKCVEAISLEEKLRNSQQKLRHSQQVIQNYEMKSKNLRPNHDENENETDSMSSRTDEVSWSELNY